ncbi:MAG: hypothetical protein IJD82_00740 [Clostridia bacterium]|nr:hypothetical protein [Clostridia bacterium]
MSPWHTKDTTKLFHALTVLKTEEEFCAFLEDACTIKEIMDISQRLRVAEMLHAGASYQTISKETGASTATISRVGKCLEYGSGGYKLVIARLAEMENNNG